MGAYPGHFNTTLGDTRLKKLCPVCFQQVEIALAIPGLTVNEALSPAEDTFHVINNFRAHFIAAWTDGRSNTNYHIGGRSAESFLKHLHCVSGDKADRPSPTGVGDAHNLSFRVKDNNGNTIGDEDDKTNTRDIGNQSICCM